MGAEKAFEDKVRDGRSSGSIDVDCAVGENLCGGSGHRLGRQSGCSAGADADGGTNRVCV